MPQARHYSTPELGIQILGSTFAPGDTIHGTINRTTPIAAPGALVTITLHGRSYSRITCSSGSHHDKTTYQASFNFFNPASTTQILLNSPLHVENGDHAAWPFSITIPPTVDMGALRSSCSPQASYERIGDPDRELPGSFTFSYKNPLSSFEGYVEYYVEATLQVFSEKPVKAQTATFPLFLRTPSAEPPITDFMLRAQRFDRRNRRPYKFMSHQLVSGLEHIGPSLLQEAQRLFHWKSVPTLGVEFQVTTPRVIQLEHPTHMQFYIRAVPAWERTSGIVQYVPQLIRLDSVTLEIVARTGILYMRSYQPRHAYVRHNIPLSGYTNAEGQECYLPFFPDDPLLDVGELTNLRVGYNGSIGGDSTGTCRLWPAFTAFGIRHGRHTLHWCIRVSLFGEKKKNCGSQSVEILSASSSDWLTFPLLGESLIGRASELPHSDDESSNYSSFYSSLQGSETPLVSGTQESKSRDTSPPELGQPPPYWSVIKPYENPRHVI